MTLHERGDTFSQSKTFHARTVQVVRLDEELGPLGISVVDFMKIDVEGHELFVLRGLGELLSQRRVRAFTFEFGAANVNSRTFFREFWDLIHPAGYRGVSGSLPVAAVCESTPTTRPRILPWRD